MTADDKVIELLGRVASTRKSAQFKAVLPFVVEQLSLGAQQQHIVTVLNRCGLDITIETFYTYLYRVRKSGEVDRLNASLFSAHAPPVPVVAASTGSAVPVARFTVPPNPTAPTTAVAQQATQEANSTVFSKQVPSLPAVSGVVEIAALGKYEPDYAQFKKMAKNIASKLGEPPAKK